MMSSLHLDADDEPRSRAMGATSRANSVRFDETANQNHFSSHATRPSLDLTSRQSSGYSGGVFMSERTPSHKSEARASSAHSLRSAASGRASSLNLDYGTGESSSPLEPPAVAPGRILLGATPSIIRCWLDRNFKHSNLHYAVVCSGSCRSWMDLRLIKKLGVEQAIRSHDEGPRTMMIRLYFSEGVHNVSISSRSRSPIATQLPSLELEFCVLEGTQSNAESKAIQVMIGSDVLMPHGGDVRFSTNDMTIFDNEGRKLTIPFVRPEDEAAYTSLAVRSGASAPAPTNESRSERKTEEPIKLETFLNGLGKSGSTIYTPSATSATTTTPPGTNKYRPPFLGPASVSSESTKLGATGSDTEARPVSRQSNASRPSLSQLNTRQEEGTLSRSASLSVSQHFAQPPSQAAAQTTTQPASQSASTPAAATGNPPGLWTTWRRDGPPSSTAPTPATGPPDWAGASKARDPSYTRRDTGIKVLKPRTANRTFSGTVTTPTINAGTTSSSPASDGKSRFFDGGRLYKPDENVTAKSTPNAGLPVSASKPTKVNPIGEGSAFNWLDKAK